MYKKLLAFAAIGAISLLSVSVSGDFAEALTQNRLLNNVVKAHKLIKLTNTQQSPLQIDNLPIDSTAYYSPELWHTYQRLQSQQEGIPTRSAIAVYVGAKTLIKQQQNSLVPTRINHQGTNSDKLTKDIIIFLRKQGYLKYFVSKNYQS